MKNKSKNFCWYGTRRHTHLKCDLYHQQQQQQHSDYNLSKGFALLWHFKQRGSQCCSFDFFQKTCLFVEMFLVTPEMLSTMCVPYNQTTSKSSHVIQSIVVLHQRFSQVRNSWRDFCFSWNPISCSWCHACVLLFAQKTTHSFCNTVQWRKWKITI